MNTHGTRHPSRREFLKQGSLSVGGLALGTGALGAARAEAQAGELVYCGYGGSYETKIMQAYFTPFQRQTGIKVIPTTTASDLAKITAMVKANRVEWDLVDVQGATLSQLIANDLLEKLDYSVVDVSDLASEQYNHKPYAAACYILSHNIFWNSSVIKEPLTSWADVWDYKRFPGKRGFQRTPWFTLEIALVADGVPPSKLYPLDVDRAFRSLDRIKPSAVFLPNNTLTNLVASQEIVTADLNLARVKTIRDSGVPLQYTWSQAMLEQEQMAVLKGAKNKANAMKAVAYTLTTQAQLDCLKLLEDTPTTKRALARVDAELAKDLPGTQPTSKDNFYLDPIFWAEHGAKLQKRMQEWLVS